MDFSFDESQMAVRELARKVFEKLPADPVAAWRELGQAQLLGVALPEAVGGSAAGVVALCALLEQAGEAASGLPWIPSLVLAGLPLERSGRSAELLAAMARGELVLCGSFGERGEPAVSARREGSHYVLSGTETCVEGLPLAASVVVAARIEGQGRSLFLVDARAPGVQVEPQSVASGCALGRLQLQGVRVDAPLCEPAPAEALVEATLERAYLAQSAYELGLSARALALTARFASERQQFGRPIGTFQAVAQRVADAHISVETMRLTVWRAAWLTDQGVDARREIAVARTVATEAGHQVVCAAQHIHGSQGFDRSYPLHRYFLASKQNALRLGGHAFHVARLGEMLAR
ncbi:MAG TPA: acyl-CoA dehydrogenase family protein [Polyangiales bacterium]|nr:acyl-CoA dehydrogenase family protein [Polyangiales bacterium]